VPALVFVVFICRICVDHEKTVVSSRSIKAVGLTYGTDFERLDVKQRCTYINDVYDETACFSIVCMFEK